MEKEIILKKFKHEKIQKIKNKLIHFGGKFKKWKQTKCKKLTI